MAARMVGPLIPPHTIGYSFSLQFGARSYTCTVCGCVLEVCEDGSILARRYAAERFTVCTGATVCDLAAWETGVVWV